MTTVYRYNSDGTGERELYERVKVQSEAGARQLSVLSLPYASANETPEIQALIVHHPDGTNSETPAADAVDMPAPVTQQAPLYSDLKVMQVPVRGLRAGDTIEYRVLVKRKNAESPSQFWENFTFLKGAVVLAQSVTLDVPAEKYVQVWSPEIKPTETVRDGRRVDVWSNSQLKPTTPVKKTTEGDPEKKTENKPDVGWTTFHNWQEVGDWYRALAAPRAVATDALHAKSGELTKGAKMPEEQVQAIYSFVSTHIRYVGVDFGIGRYQPHAAAEVLANQYGDCKDKDTLLEALLHASGFKTAPALIGVNVDMVSELPSPAFFNHLITTVNLPSGRIWLDSTPGVAPFQMLLAPIRDKQALVIPADGASTLERTPSATPFPFVNRFEAKASLKADGELTGHIEINYRSDNEVLIRLIAQNLAPAQWDQGSQYIANLLGFSGTTSNSTFARADDTSVPMRISYDYSKKPFGDWDSFRIIPLFPLDGLPSAPEQQPGTEIDLGALRTESVTSSIQLPDGFGADLPDAVHVQTPFATFDESYKLQDGDLIAERKLVILKSKLPAESWEQYGKFAKDTSLGELTFIQLTSTHSMASGARPPKPGENSPRAAALVSEATALERSRDWIGALAKLDEAKAIQPKQPFLWSNYGYVAMVRGKFDDAKQHYRHELELHPDEPFVVQLFGGFLHGRGEDSEALAVLNAYYKNDPSDAGVDLILATIEAQKSLPDAIATLRKGSDASPSNHVIQSALAEDLVADHQDAEAATLAKKMLADAPDDPDTLNNASYLLAEANTDLPLAEESSRKSLQVQDAETARQELSEANDQTFRRANMLVASWDTLGFILTKEKKLDEARDYLEAAWRSGPRMDIGIHYAQLLELQGNMKEALRVYHQVPRPRTSSPQEKVVNDSIDRLANAGVEYVGIVNGGTALQEERTFKLQLKPAAKSLASGTYRLEVTAAGIRSAMLVSGEPHDKAEEAIKHIVLPHLVPSHSNAKLVRDAVLTCSPGSTECYFVIMPMGGIQAELAGR